jgi:type 1 fimbria pilin
MKVPGHARPRYTRLRNINPPTLYNCSDSLWHDAWSRAFDPNFKASHYYKPTLSVGANDGINLNMYQWFIRQVNTATTSLTSSSVLDEPEIGDDQQMSVSIGPNPFVSSSNVRLDLVSAGVIYMSVIDVTGKLVYSQSHSLSAGSNIISLNMENSKSGIYMLRITGKNFSSVHKIVKK